MKVQDTPAKAPVERPLALAGRQVIELSSYVASPLGGMTLAQLGADVIGIDHIGGTAYLRRWPLAPSERPVVVDRLRHHSHPRLLSVFVGR